MTEYVTGNKYKCIMKILKIKKDKPTVVEINGDRYVHMPKTKWE